MSCDCLYSLPHSAVDWYKDCVIVALPPHTFLPVDQWAGEGCQIAEKINYYKKLIKPLSLYKHVA